MSKLATRKPSVIRDPRGNHIVVFTLDIPKEGEINLKHPGLADLIETYITHAYKTIGETPLQVFHQPMIKCWQADPAEYAQRAIELIQRRSRNTEEVRYFITYNGNEVYHNLQFLREDDESNLALIYVPGFSIRTFSSGPKPIEGTEICRLTMNFDMSFADADVSADSIRFHASRSTPAVESFLNHVLTVYDTMLMAQNRRLALMYKQQDMEYNNPKAFMPLVLKQQDVLDQIKNAAHDVFEDRKDPRSTARSNVYVEAKILTVIVDMVPYVTVTLEVKRSLAIHPDQPAGQWNWKSYWTERVISDLPPDAPAEEVKSIDAAVVVEEAVVESILEASTAEPDAPAEVAPEAVSDGLGQPVDEAPTPIEPNPTEGS